MKCGVCGNETKNKTCEVCGNPVLSAPLVSEADVAQYRKECALRKELYEARKAAEAARAEAEMARAEAEKAAAERARAEAEKARAEAARAAEAAEKARAEAAKAEAAEKARAEAARAAEKARAEAAKAEEKSARLQALLKSARKHRDACEYSAAIEDYTEAIRLAPEDYNVYNARGVAYYSKKDYDRAIADFTEAIRLNPKDAVHYDNRGNAYKRKKDYDRAIADFTEAIRLNSKDAFYYNERGVAYYSKKDYDRAIADFTEAIRLNPKDAVYYNNRGNAYYSKKDYERAIADHEKALSIDPNYEQAKNSLALARQTGRPAGGEKSNTAYTTVSSIGSTGPGGGIVFYDKGDSDGGWRYLEAAPASAEFTSNRNDPRKRCANLTINGLSGWRLPSKEELNWMYGNLKKKGLGGFTDKGYWSSSEDKYCTAWYQNFYNGFQNTATYNYDTYSVRPVRAF